jgi:3-oxoacyl-[acyl-carrier-protein] synthase-1
MALAITGAGMITSVGPNLTDSCAAIRAGIVRSEEIDHFMVLDADTQESVPIIGRPIHGFSEGFFVLGFWVRAGLACLQDMVRSAALPPASDTAFWSATGLLAVTPPVAGARFETDDSFTPAMLKTAYLERLLQVFPYPITDENTGIVCVGHAGTVAAVAQAESMVAGGLKRVIILAADSYLDPLTLDWLAATSRLKLEENPVGLTPGEAAACFMVESAASSTSRRATELAILAEAAVGFEENHYLSGQRPQGVALATAISRALARSGGGAPFSGDIFADLNGEEWRAYEFGVARAHLNAQLGKEASFVFPCSCLGDVGGASGAVAICCAMRSLQRGYSHADTVLVTSSSETGTVGAVCVTKPL